jgi:L,D-transpeptidase YcbB
MKYKALLLSLLVLLLASCEKKDVKLIDVQAFKDEKFEVNRSLLFSKLIKYCGGERSNFHRNVAIREYYKQYGNLIWSDNFKFDKADTLISWLKFTEADGINQHIFHIKKERHLINKLRNYDIKKGESITKMLAELDFLLSEDYLRYVDGMKFGFVNPESVYNNLEYMHSMVNPADSTNHRRILFDMNIYHPDAASDLKALECVSSSVDGFISASQPRNPDYNILKKELSHCKDSTLRYKIAVNMERYRWQPIQKEGSKYVWVNLAQCRLYGIDRKSENILNMKICEGAVDHKTPVLSSLISYMQINPYWVIPKSIVRREIIPCMQRNYNYLQKRDIEVLDRNGHKINPHSVHWNSSAESIPYTFRQNSGGENSLGRLIFRFKNNFSIFLHDTNSRWVFSSATRTVSHGCIRLEHPVDLAWFLMKHKDNDRLQKIKYAITQDSIKHPDTYVFSESVPLFIKYYTVYVDDKRNVVYCNDPYKYDEPLKEALKHL